MRFAVPAVLLGALISPAPAHATTMIYVSIPALYQKSDVVVRGTVESHRSFWGERGQLFTDWTVRVDEVLHGRPQLRVVVRQLGGEIGEARAQIPGDAELRDGENVVLFLVEQSGLHYLTALGQAKLSFGADGKLNRDLSRISFFDRSTRQVVHRSSETMTLEQLRAVRVP
jgi:hypothetical protein